MPAYKVILVCAAGCSSSLLEVRTREAAQRHNVDLSISAVSVGTISIYDYAAYPVDLILIAPQVRYKKKSVSASAEPYGVQVQDIDPIIFGMVDGDKLFDQIMHAVKTATRLPT
jgi:cellobiose PTS system EIIB component